MSKKLTVLSLSILLASTGAMAGGDHESYNTTSVKANDNSSYDVMGWRTAPYMGVEVGRAHMESTPLSSNYNTLTPYLGVRFGPYWGLEASYTTSDRESNAVSSSRFTDYNLDAMGYLPLDAAHRFELIGLVGYGHYDLHASNTTSDDDNAFRFGGGAQYNFTNHVAARVLYRRIETDTAVLGNTDSYTAGITYSF